MLQFTTWIVIFEIIVITECNPQRSINLVLETVLAFDNKGNEDIKLIDDIQDLLTQMKDAIREKNGRRSFNNKDNLRFTDLVKEAIKTLKTYNDNDLEDVFAVIDREIRKYRRRGSSFDELIENKNVRRYVKDRFDGIKGKQAQDIRRYLNEVLRIIGDAELARNRPNIVDYIDSLYEKNGEKLRSVIDSLKQYGNPHKRANMNLVNIVRDGLRMILFDHNSSLNVNARTNIKNTLESLWSEAFNENNVHESVEMIKKSDTKDKDEGVYDNSVIKRQDEEISEGDVSVTEDLQSTSNETQKQSNSKTTDKEYNNKETSEESKDSLNESIRLYKKIKNHYMKKHEKERSLNAIENPKEINENRFKKRKTTTFFISLDKSDTESKKIDKSTKKPKFKRMKTLYPESIKLYTRDRFESFTKINKIQTIWPEKRKPYFRAKPREYFITKNLNFKIKLQGDNKHTTKHSNSEIKSKRRVKSYKNLENNHVSSTGEKEETEMKSNRANINKDTLLKRENMGQDMERNFIAKNNYNRHRPKTPKRKMNDNNKPIKEVHDGMSIDIASYERSKNLRKNSQKKEERFVDIELVDGRTTKANFTVYTRYPQLEFWEGTEKSTRATEETAKITASLTANITKASIRAASTTEATRTFESKPESRQTETPSNKPKNTELWYNQKRFEIKTQETTSIPNVPETKQNLTTTQQTSLNDNVNEKAIERVNTPLYTKSTSK